MSRSSSVQARWRAARSQINGAVGAVRQRGMHAAIVGFRMRLAGHHRPLDDVLLAPLDGARTIEIGGPTDRFANGGPFPIYSRVKSCDCVQWQSETAWHRLDENAPFAPEGAPLGRLHLVAGDDLGDLPGVPYDAVVSCHVIEHFANPMRALVEWRAALRPGGHVFVVAPHGAATFDHKRPATPLAHMLQDYKRGTGEDDLTHLDETLRLHDRRRDPTTTDDTSWAAERQNNFQTRLLHHHVFHGSNLAGLIDAAGFQLRWVRAQHPHDIIVLAERLPDGEEPDNAALLALSAPWRRESPFSVDRGA